MAKSKRSKHMRAMRRLLREKLSKKDEAKRLTSMKKDIFIPAKNNSLDDDKEMQISTNTTTEYNVRTLKNKDGQFPSWLSGRQRKRLQAKQAVVKRIAKKKKSKTPGKKEKKKINLNTSDAMLT
ncbi:unnamed protein product [Rotaria magnacalcarata]|uniref:Uncharacterized protein n=2 Tax=Rotaria magnacalcarata TaxID=392030 RepID=A0A816PIL4_9BILA|nr:unnamed protein product [Rotaria magnacalcarata]CAF1663898.1 unnamed protein product [Rotaria magnacalcarata]CAF2029280.1 unnamed protein product [Rotaria magnacalcarata]CAF2049179.1 unnamed protein product [Rotaria magnacalcarata]CAF2138342.1 unnamed protein product [Rotaria magnacalcarata]